MKHRTHAVSIVQIFLIAGAASGQIVEDPELLLVEPQTFDGYGETGTTDLNDNGLSVGRITYSYRDDNGNGHTVVGTYDWRYGTDPEPLVTNAGWWTNNRGDRVTPGSPVDGSVFRPGGGGPEIVIPPLAGHTYVLASEITDTGMVVGTSGIFRIGSLNAIVWTEKGGTIDLQTMVPLAREAVYASENGYVVGHRPASDGRFLHGFFLDLNTGDWVDLFDLFNPGIPTGQGRTIVRAVNDSAQVVGETTTGIGSGQQAFIWSPTDGVTFIPNPFGGDPMRVYANHINDQGVVVGEALSSNGWLAYAWTADEGFIDLQSLVAGSGYQLSSATRINSRGEISGNAARVTSPFIPNTGYILAASDLGGSDCLPDTNGDGDLTPADFTAWIDAFNNSLPACDQNGDDSCDPSDFSAWINNFNAGCL